MPVYRAKGLCVNARPASHTNDPGRSRHTAGIRLAILFGSLAADREWVESDLDLAVTSCAMTTHHGQRVRE